ncbi:hypothetical protein DTO006G1_8526 [Penicillium roqueforti]|uniref:uncharacterized protein n=1 Tax=Penicillium roqueforti TaxID=5082 RepID=UPI00190DA49A|nr:uncharacterized protein LCP9604111_53 [Penicillium roqueforti]KAF9252527.1 hypothetical protein LCP9604111_53 [Penicillium roqueforti]KAI1835597.1 hypothetical protein CBS147337_3620 [Penicillium roqueforti]KAI2675551.1 hypothetical protein CBS147355_6545 [Penicillium roqueforti]KAI2687166.1 hypothetical protein LCP963914a_3767 [Penicillium roqueforti]KAI2716176.1 hypothetical protein CBS147354_6976 [Penicillium roqueforti]
MSAAPPTSTTTRASVVTVTGTAGLYMVANELSIVASKMRDSIAATSSSTTKATSTKSTRTKTSTTKTSTTTTVPVSTQTVNGIVTVSNGWSLKMFDGIGCTGSYVLVQGHNKKLEDSDCMKFRAASNLATVVNNTAVSCRWWTLQNGKWEWRDCHSDALNSPKSWRMSNGLCTVSPNPTCDLVSDISQTYGWRGPGLCHDRQQMDPKFVSFKCYVG